MKDVTVKQKINFVSAIRTHKHHVDVTYRMPETDDEFVVSWSDIHAKEDSIRH